MSKILFLTGMPGSGKTYWADQLSKAFGIPALDLDSSIEQLAGKTISQLFHSFGEQTFRDVETETLRQIISENPKPFILSTGGGTPLRASNLELMKQHGLVVYLKAQPETLQLRLQHSASVRPLLTGDGSLEQKLSSLLAERRALYERADLTLEVDNLEINDFEPIIRQCIEQQ